MGQSPGLIGHLLCKPEHFAIVPSIDGWGVVQVGVAAIHQHYCVTFHRGRFTTVNRGAEWKRNEQSVLIAESVYHPLLLANS